jgi:hypothetical protein
VGRQASATLSARRRRCGFGAVSLRPAGSCGDAEPVPPYPPTTRCPEAARVLEGAPCGLDALGDTTRTFSDCRSRKVFKLSQLNRLSVVGTDVRRAGS